MTEFEDNLWRELEETYGSDLSDADGPLHRRSRLRTPVIAGTSLGVAGAGAAAVIVLTAGSAAPAFAVTSHRDGSVSVVIRRIDGIPGANRRLAQLGIRARAVQVAVGCKARLGRPVAGVPVMTLATERHQSRVTATPGAIHAQIRPRQDSERPHPGHPRGPGRGGGPTRTPSRGQRCDPQMPASGSAGPDRRR